MLDRNDFGYSSLGWLEGKAQFMDIHSRYRTHERPPKTAGQNGNLFGEYGFLGNGGGFVRNVSGKYGPGGISP
ncbi:MAG: hypothetical protein Q7U02_08200 [Desulfosalsimonadaceae bacterium]|nr:hypothetical protein [Desulfosalsimonadaceae bacterium]